jgi:hypothetical protein
MIREEVVGTKKRKTRSDKKRDVKPTIFSNLKECIYRKVASCTQEATF